MSRIKKNVEDIDAIKSEAIKLKPTNGIPSNSEIHMVDMYHGVIKNGAATQSPPLFEVQRMPFPTDCLPAAYANMAKEISRVVLVPKSLPGVTVLGVISAALGSGLEGNLFPGKITSPNEYFSPVAESGVGKSETARRCTAPIRESDWGLRDAWEREGLPELLTDKILLEKEIQEITKLVKANTNDDDRRSFHTRLQAKNKALAAVKDKLEADGPTLMVEDTTTQKLAVTLKYNDETLALISSDGGDVINNILGRNHKLDRVDDSLYVKAFSRDPVKVLRIGRATVLLEHPCLTIILMVQPDKIDTLFNNRQLVDGGLLPRFLIAMTDAQPEHMAEDQLEFSPSVLQAYNQAVGDLLLEFRTAKVVRRIEATPEARKAMVEFYNQIVDRRRQQYQSIAVFAARYAEHAGKLALILHGAKHGREAANHSLDLETAQNAIKLMEYFIQEQLAILQATATGSLCSKADKILNFASTNGGEVTSRELQRKRIVKNAAEAKELLTNMAKDGKITAETGNGGKKTVFIVNDADPNSTPGDTEPDQPDETDPEERCDNDGRPPGYPSVGED